MEDPLAGLTEEERQEAERLARIAEQAEKRAAERLAAKLAATNNTNTPNSLSSSSSSSTNAATASLAIARSPSGLPLPPKRNIGPAPGSLSLHNPNTTSSITYLSKAERERQQLSTIGTGTSSSSSSIPTNNITSTYTNPSTNPSGKRERSRSRSPPLRSSATNNSNSSIHNNSLSKNYSTTTSSSTSNHSTSTTTTTTTIAPMYGVNDGYKFTNTVKQEFEASKSRYLGDNSSSTATNTSNNNQNLSIKNKHKRPNPRDNWDASEDTSINNYDILYERTSDHIIKAAPVTTTNTHSSTISRPPSTTNSSYPNDRHSYSNTNRRSTTEEEEEASAGWNKKSSSSSSSSSSNAHLIKSSDNYILPSIRNAKNQRLLPNEKEEPHWTTKSLSQMTKRDWRIFCEDYNIIIRDNHTNVYPLRNWDEINLDPDIRKAIKDMNYKEPSPIQRATIPIGIAGKDLIGIAETGSGKTASFLIPLLHYVMSQSLGLRARVHEMGPLALIMAPTRELAQQIDEECRKISKYCGIKSVAIVGGNNINEQAMRLRQGCEIVIGTPGRLIDCINQHFLVLHQCRYVVLDEADRMIDLGFELQLNQILDAMLVSSNQQQNTNDSSNPIPETEDIGGEQVSTHRTTHMFTATMPPSVERLAKTYLKRPVTVRIGDDDGGGKNRRITQELIFLANEHKKYEKLLQLLPISPRPLIIFLNAKKSCDILNRDLENRGYYPAVLHSGKVQEQREEALHNFKSGNTDILIATDVAGRGLDIPNVAQVINYDMTSEIDRYTHRIGRTGRAGKSGSAITFLTTEDNNILPALRTYLESTNQPIPPELDKRINSNDGKNNKGRDTRPIEFD